MNITRNRARRLNLLADGESDAPESRAASVHKFKATGQNEPVKEVETAQNAWKVDTANMAVRGGGVWFVPGKLNFKGKPGLAPMQVQGQLLAERLPVQAFEPYFADLLDIELLRLHASFKGMASNKQMPAKLSLLVDGDAALEKLKTNTLGPSADLPLERLFLGAGNSGKEASKADAKAEAKPDTEWVPRADLNIAM